MPITLKEFLKKFTGVPISFINKYFKFYEMCEEKQFGINVEDAITYLEITKKEAFYKRIREKYRNGIDYINVDTGDKNMKDVKRVNCYLTLDTFEKICMMSHSKKADSVRDYFITLRDFVNYYKEYLNNMIMNSQNTSCVYIICVNKKRKLYKLGSSSDLRKRIQTYSTGKEKHPDFYFIMVINKPKQIEKCAHNLIDRLKYKPNKEIYKTDVETLKGAIYHCAIAGDKLAEFDKKHAKKDKDYYVVFEYKKNYIPK